MPETPVVKIADKEKLQAILSERGLPIKVGAKLTATEQKIHNVLCAAYNFNTGLVALEMPQQVFRRTGPEFQKLWLVKTVTNTGQGKVEVVFVLTPEAIKTTIKTVLRKDSGIFRSKINQVQLHTSWSKYFRPKEKKVEQVDWSKEVRVAQKRNEAIKQEINDGKTFNAQKDNPWARKHLKNKGQ